MALNPGNIVKWADGRRIRSFNSAMHNFPDDLLGRLRTLPQALSDLVAKHNNMQVNHPARSELALMIFRLKTEIALRERRAPDLSDTAWGLC